MARALFLLGSLYGASVALAWVPWRLGLVAPPTIFAPQVWLQHEILFGAGAALMAGPLAGPLAGGVGGLVLAALWLLGRAAVYLGGMTEPLAAHAGLMLFLVAAVLLAAGRRRWILAALAAGQGVFLWEVWRYGAGEYGLALGLAAAALAALSRSSDRPTAVLALLLAAGAYAWGAGWGGLWAPDRYVASAAWEAAMWGLVAALALPASNWRPNWRRGAVLLAAAVPLGLALQPGWVLVLGPLGGVAWAAAMLRR